MDTRQLVERCVGGDDAAWRDLLATYDTLLRHLARIYLRSLHCPEADAHVDEILAGVQEMLIAHDARLLRSFRWQCSFETWLRVVVRTVCVRSVRRRKVDPRDLPPPPAPMPPLERLLAEERATAVRNALDALPERERRVLSLFFIDGKPYREIAQELRLPMGSVATILARTRERLKAILDSKGF